MLLIGRNSLLHLCAFLGLGLFALAMASSVAGAQTYTVTGRTDYAAGQGLEWVAIWDLNNDGHKDLVTANYLSNDVSVLLNDGAGGFLPRTDYPAGTGPFTVVVTDLNNDIQADLLVANHAAGTISVLIGNGTGTFGTRTDFASGPNTSVAATGYFNADGNVDVVTVNFGNSTASVFLGDGLGGFAPKVDYPTGANPNWVAVGDFNSDNISDLVTANYGASTISVLLGNGNGTFAAKTDSPVGLNPLTLKLAHLDGDGILDVATANYNANTVSVRLGNGTGGFGPKTDYPTGAKPVTVTAGDLNIDGKVDLATSNEQANTVSFLIGDGAGGFAPKVDHAVGTTPYAVAIGDVTGDGEPDLVSANYTTNNISVLSGDVPGGFRVNMPAAALTARDQHGVARSLSDYLGKWVLVDVSSVWCGPCNFLAREAQQVYDTWIANPSIQFEYVTSLVDGPSPWNAATQVNATKWATRYQITRPVLHGDGKISAANRGWMDGLSTNAYPTLVYIDPTGTIRAVDIGAADGQAIVDRIAQLAGVASPALSPPPPPLPPPPPPPAPRTVFHAMQGATVEISYGATTWSGFVPVQEVLDDGLSTRLVDTPYGLPGIPTQGVISIVAGVDSTTAQESVSIFIGTLNPLDPPIPMAEPWQVRLTGVSWPDGLPRVVAPENSPVVSAVFYDPVQQADQYFVTPIRPVTSSLPTGFEFTSFALGNVPDVPAGTNAFSVNGIVLQHVGTVSAMPPAGAQRLALATPVPNPAGKRTTLRWTMPREAPATLRVVDVAGRVVRGLHAGMTTAGEHTTRWDLTDDAGRRVAAGLYFAVFTTEGETRSTRLVIVD